MPPIYWQFWLNSLKRKYNSHQTAILAVYGSIDAGMIFTLNEKHRQSA
jgi:hypothetical protein